ncbi:O-antigen ligase family protein, partial [Elusimicrobiota bacterium]
LLAAAGVVLAAAAVLFPVPHHPGAGLLFPYYNYTVAVEAALFAACLGAWGAGYCRERPGRRVLLGLLMAVALGVVLWEGSRGGLLAVSAASLVWLWRRGHRRLLAGAALALLALAALDPGGIASRVLKRGHPAALTRPRIWMSAAAIVREHPVLGRGPAQFERGFTRHNLPAPEDAWPARYGLRSTHAHSEPLHIAAETGLPGLALFLIALLLTMGQALRERPKRDWTVEAAHAAFIALLAQSSIDNILALPAVGWLFFSALGISARDQEPETPPGPKLPLPAAACIAGLVLAALAWWPGWAVSTWRARAFEERGPEAVRWMERALRLAPDSDVIWADMARIQLRRRPPEPLAALAALSEAEERHPTEALYPLMSAEILRSGGRWKAVRMLAARAVDLEPRCLQGRLLLSESLLRTGSRAQAREAFAAFEEWESRPIPPHQLKHLLVLQYDKARRDRLQETLGSSAY